MNTLKHSAELGAAVILAGVMGIAARPASANVVTVPQSALTPSTTLYTDQIGGGIGDVVPMFGIADGRNDDYYSAAIDLGFSLNFFGNTYTQFYINNNGNVSFGSGISEYTPSGPQGASQPIISPFFADVDTRNPDSGVVRLRQDANQDIVTWDNVGYYSEHADKLDDFQLVLRGPDYSIPAGEGQIGFFWTTMQWETGDASGGSGGFGGTPAAVGFGDGNDNGEILQGSIQNDISQVVQDHYIWFDLDNGVPVVTPPSGGSTSVPEPGALALFGLGLLALGAMGPMLRSRRAARESAA